MQSQNLEPRSESFDLGLPLTNECHGNNDEGTIRQQHFSVVFDGTVDAVGRNVLVMVDLVLLESPYVLPLEDSVFFGRQIASDQRKRDDSFSCSAEMVQWVTELQELETD